jgi:hypothetical protein
MQLPTKRKLLLCLSTLPLSGILAIVALLLRKFVGLPGEDLAEWAGKVVSSNYIIAQYLYILAYVLPFFGFWALYMYLMQHNEERLAFWGLMGTLLGTGLPLTTLGVFAYASPALGKLFLQGDTHLPQVITEIAMGSSMIMGMPGAFLYVGGCVLFGIAVWKSGAIAKWSGVILALHGLFVSFGFSSPPVLTLSWILLIVSGIWFILSMQRWCPLILFPDR